MKLVTCILTFGALFAATHAAAASRDAACDVAAAALAARLAKVGEVIVTGITGDDRDIKREVAWRRPETRSDAPPPGLVQAWAAAPNKDVLTCAPVVRLLTARKIPFGDSTVTAATTGDDGKPTTVWRANILSVGMPILSGDGQMAVVEVGYTCGGLCGSGFLLYLRRKHGAWVGTGALPLWIS